MQQIIIVFCGCRWFTDYDFMRDKANFLTQNVDRRLIKIRTGDSKGADACAVRYAQEMNYPYEVFHAAWKTEGKAAGPIRNGKMAKDGATHCIAFWDGVSAGTKNMIDLARAAGLIVKVVKIVKPDPEPRLKMAKNINPYIP